MAILTGYLKYGYSVHRPAEFADVFEPEGQYDSDKLWESSDIFWMTSQQPLQVKNEDIKNKEQGRFLTGQSSDSPSGERVGKYSDDLYYRIHLTPAVLHLGNLISSQQRSVEVWNAFFVTSELTDVQTLNGEGLTITPPVGTPYTMLPLQSLVYLVAVSTDGPPTVAATLRWTIETPGSDDYDVPVTGIRVIPWPMTPDWGIPMLETLEWKTDVIRSRNAEEQRARIRSKARRGQSYQYILTADQAASVENLLWGWQARVFAVPHWTETTLQQQELFQGQTAIVTDTDKYSYTAGALIFITDGIIHEMQEIQSVSSGLVTLSKGLDSFWLGPYVIGPANLARIDGDFKVKINRDTSDVLKTVMQWAHEPITTDPFLPALAAPTTYAFDGNELWLKPPNWKAGIATDVDTDGLVLDFGLQGFATTTRSGKPLIVREYEWFLHGRDQMLEFRQFLGRRQGRLSGFWMPSFNTDFTLLEQASASQFGFIVKDNFYGVLVNADPGRDHLILFFKDGTYMVRKIESTSTDAGETNLITDAANGFIINPSDIVMMCVLGWYRLNSDKVTIKYSDRNFATAKITLANILT